MLEGDMKENAEYGRREEVTTRQRPTVATYDIPCACEYRCNKHLWGRFVLLLIFPLGQDDLYPSEQFSMF